MKIRNGFVSNSSSSSFLIYGAEISEIDFPNKDEILDSEKWQDLSFERQPDCEYVYVGISWGSVKDDETGLQFKQRVEKQIKEMCGQDIACETISAAWYDG